jgi:hypothetical protein
MGGTAPRSLCLGGELLIPLRGAAVLFVHRPWISEKLQSGTNKLYLNSLQNEPAYYLRLHHRHRALAVRPPLVRHNGPVSTRL